MTDSQTLTCESRDSIAAFSSPIQDAERVVADVLEKVSELCARDEHELAMQLLGEILDDYPDCADAWHQTGVVAGSLGDPKAALLCMQKSIQLEPDNSNFHNNLGCLLNLLELNEQAIDAFMQAIRCDENNVAALGNLVGLLDVEHQLDAIRACIEKLVSLDPEDATVAAIASDLGIDVQVAIKTEDGSIHDRLNRLI